MITIAFDPADERRLLDGKVGYAWCLGHSFEESRDVGGLASSAGFYLNKAIQCFLVGYDEPANALLARAHEWLAVDAFYESGRGYSIHDSEAVGNVFAVPEFELDKIEE
jgi:hypothetical protein